MALQIWADGATRAHRFRNAEMRVGFPFGPPDMNKDQEFDRIIKEKDVAGLEIWLKRLALGQGRYMTTFVEDELILRTFGPEVILHLMPGQMEPNPACEIARILCLKEAGLLNG